MNHLKNLHQICYNTASLVLFSFWLSGMWDLNVLLLLLLLSHFSCVRLCVTPETAAHQAPPSLGFSRQDHWSGLPFPSLMYERKSESEVAQSCPTLSDLMDCSLPDFHPWDFPG